MRMSKNLEQEIKVDEIKIGVNECQVPFKNGSTIFTATYSENALGKVQFIYFKLIMWLNLIFVGGKCNEYRCLYRRRN